jgi:hypothetical protein
MMPRQSKETSMTFPVLAVFIVETGVEAVIKVFSDADLDAAIDNHPEWTFSHCERTQAEFDHWVHGMEHEFA